MTILRMTPGSMGGGLISFRLAIWKDGAEVAKWTVNSGQPGAQSLRTYEDPKSIPNNMEPIPEGVYPLRPTLVWAGKPGDYDTWFSSALGPVMADIYAKGDTTPGYRGLFRIHLDGNRSSAPGSAGCPVLRNMADLKSFVALYNTHRPEKLVVDYGLGTAPSAPTGPKPEKSESMTNNPVARVVADGETLGPALLINGFSVPTMATLAALLDLTLEWDNETKTITVSK